MMSCLVLPRPTEGTKVSAEVEKKYRVPGIIKAGEIQLYLEDTYNLEVLVTEHMSEAMSKGQNYAFCWRKIFTVVHTSHISN